LAAKFSHCRNDDYELLQFKDFQDHLTSNSKTSKGLFGFQGLSRSWKTG